MDVKIEICENVKFIEKISVLGVATDDGNYKKNIVLHPRVKRRIAHYSSSVDKIHSILAFLLIKEDIHLYHSIQLCSDVSKNKLMNNLRKLFKANKHWSKLESTKKIRILAVKDSYVDKYVKQVRKGREPEMRVVKYEEIREYISYFGYELKIEKARSSQTLRGK